MQVQPAVPLCLVVACARNGVIGRDNTLPWRLPADLRHFRALTMGKPLIMGRRTWDSLGRPLPGRQNIVLTRESGFNAEGAMVAHSFDAAHALALGEAHKNGAGEIMVIGGAALYVLALPLADRLYLTRVHADVPGDTFFPSIDCTQWAERSCEDRAADAENPLSMSFLYYERCARMRDPR